MGFQSVHHRIPSSGKFLPTGLAFEILNHFLRSMNRIPHQRMDALTTNPVIFTCLVRTEVTACADFLLRSTFAFSQCPSDWPFALRRFPFPLVLLTEAAVTLALGAQHGRFSWSFPPFLLAKQVAQPNLAQFSVDFYQKNEKCQQYQQVFEQGLGWSPFCECANRPILSPPYYSVIYHRLWTYFKYPPTG